MIGQPIGNRPIIIGLITSDAAITFCKETSGKSSQG